MIPFPNKKYNTIVLDPPWNISMTGKVKRENWDSWGNEV